MKQRKVIPSSITETPTSSAKVQCEKLEYFCSRRHRIRSLPGHFGYRLMAGGEEGMSPAELRALPVIIHERPYRASRQQEGKGSISEGLDLEEHSVTDLDSKQLVIRSMTYTRSGKS